MARPPGIPRIMSEAGLNTGARYGIAGRLRRYLRDVPGLRKGVVLCRTALHPMGGAKSGVLILFYHDMKASERRAFERQIGYFRDFGDLVGLQDAMQILTIGDAGRYVCLTFDDGCQGAYNHAVPILVAHAAPAAFFVVPHWIDAQKPGTMRWDECRQMVQAGIELGSHSLTHRRLAQLDISEAKREFSDSRVRIEQETGQSCRAFACPWGQPGIDYHPQREAMLAREAGYSAFLTTRPQRAFAGNSLWELPRVRMEPGWGRTEMRYACGRP